MSAVAAPLTVRLQAPEVSPVETIRTVLKRDVADILRANLPELRMIAREKVYDTVMDDPALLHKGFRLFRGRPELFAGLVRTAANAAPKDDNDILRCGRNVAEIVAMVVRSCARRYFKKRLGHPRMPVAPRPKVGLIRTVLIELGLASPPARPKRKRGPSLGDRLYDALRDFLQFEWQVPLIPAYAALSPDLVTRMGPKLLDIRDPMKVQVLADPSTESAVMEGRMPLLLDNAKRLLSGNGETGNDTINAEVLWSVCQKMRLAALFPGFDNTEMRKAVALIAATSPAALHELMPALGDDIRKFTLYLFTCYGVFGPMRYRQVFGAQGQIWAVQAMAKRIASAPPLTGTHEQMKASIVTWLDQAITALDAVDDSKVQTAKNLDRIK